MFFMIVSKSKDIVLFCTHFNEEFDLVQKLSGATPIKAYYNTPIDFREAGLKYKSKRDIWHIDVPFAYSTDEAPALMVNSKWLGENHIFPFAVALHIQNHGKTCGDIGSLWEDAEGTKWTLTNVAEEVLTFVSENIGESYTNYAFKTEIASKLIHIEGAQNTDYIDCNVESWKTALAPSTRITKCEITTYKDGKAQPYIHQTECDYAEIHQEYDLVNPVSMVEEIHKSRPHTSPYYGALGETMVRVSRLYRIENDGTITSEFKFNKNMDVHLMRCMGAMFQEKLNTYGGGLFRYIPKAIPFVCKDGTFDFTKPIPIEQTEIPKKERLTPKFWEDAKNPPDRIIDYFRNMDGKDVMGFSCGYLPLYDGVPEIRTKQLESTVLFGGTRKAYPLFMEGDIEECHGIAYRKYFEIEKNKTSVYTIPYGDKTYIYVDLFEEDTVNIPLDTQPKLYEKADEISYSYENGILTVAGVGYSMFIN